MSHIPVVEAPESRQAAGAGLIDADVHNLSYPDVLLPFLERRWAEYLKTYGMRTRHERDITPALRPYAARADSAPPSGVAGSDPLFARDQLLDPFGIDVAILNNVEGQSSSAGGNAPVPFCAALERANNDWTMECWFTTDERWRSSVSVQYDNPSFAAKEIERCRELDDRFVQILVSTRTERPFGHEKYWPLFEVATHYDMPIAFHPAGSGMHQLSGSGWPSYYYENHTSYPFPAISHIASLIFEGVFDRWPTLKINLMEAGWSWAAPYAWRLDATWEVLRSEVAHLARRPSEYLREHFWFTTQPIEEPENPKWFPAVYEQFEAVGLGGKLMFSSDYPHWDFDSPAEAIPHSLPDSVRDDIYVNNAAGLYGFPVERRSA